MRAIVAAAVHGARLCAPAEALRSAGAGPRGPAAARLGDPFKHKSFAAALAGAVAGALLGAAVVAAAVAITGATGGAALGVAVAATLAAAPAIAAVSAAVSGFFDAMGSPDGNIISGSSDVLIEGKPAARAEQDAVACRKHKGPIPIAEGSSNVFINGSPAARVGDKIGCGGGIMRGASQVFIGGTAQALSVAEAFSPAQRLLLFAVEFLVPPTAGLWRGAAKILSGKAVIGAARNAAGAVAKAAAYTSKRAGGGAKAFAKRVRTKDPVDVVTGEVVDCCTDLALGRTLPLTLTRYYCSGDAGGDTLGPGWRENWNERIVVRRTPEGLALDLQLADGQGIPYDLPPAYRAGVHPDHPHWRLERRDGYFALCDLVTGGERRFSLVSGELALLSAELDAYGNRVDFQRDQRGRLARIVHSDGIVLTVEHDGQGRLRRVQRLLDGAAVELVRYGYADGYLCEAWARSGHHLFYRYDGRGLLCEWRDTQHTWARYRYDALGRCVEVACAGGFYSGSLHYDPANRTTAVTDSQGRITRYRYNAQKLVTHVTNPLGETTETEYDAHERVVAEIDPLGRCRAYAYDEQGRLSAITAPDGTCTRFEYDGDRRHPARVIDPLGQVWRYRYNFAGQPVSVESPQGRITRYRYHATGQLAEQLTPAGRTLRWEYDAAQRLAAYVDGAGQRWRYEYDALDRCVTRVDPQGHRTLLEYDERDRCVACVDADGNRVSVDYDSEHNPVTWRDGEGRQSHAAYGPFDLCTVQTDAGGAAYRFEYDRDYARLVAVVNPIGQRYEYRLDAAGRVIEEIDYAGGRTRYQYDPAGQLIAKTNALGQTIRYEYDALGRCLLEQADGEAPIRYEYDALGRLVRASNGDCELGFAYDPDGRLIEERQHDARIGYRYDGDGLCTQRLLYLPGQDQPHVTHFAFDGNGLLERLTLPQTSPLHIQRDGRGLPLTVHSHQGFWLQQRYTPGGLLAEQQAGYGRGERLPQWPAGVPLDVGLQRHYRYDRSGLPRLMTDRDVGERRYRYDVAARVVEVQGTYGAERFDYGPLGELRAMSRQGGAGLPERWRLSHHAGRVRSRNDERYLYDAAGRLIQKDHLREGFRPEVWQYRYNARGELIGLRGPRGERWRYVYDPLGRRIEKRNENNGRIQRSVWSGDVLAAELGGQYRDGRFLPGAQAEVWVFSPGGFVPLAKQRLRFERDPLVIAHYQAAFPGQAPPPQCQTWFAVTDHLGTPQALLSARGEVVWRADYATWGAVLGTQHHPDPELRTDCPLRFLGQYADAESGLHYNRFRYYDPQTGQYLTPDPIGLAGGLTPQAYVPNPLAWVDPLGLAGCPRRGSLSAEEANAPHVEKGRLPPYAEGTRARDIVLQRERIFVRVHGDGNQARSWMMRPRQIEGLTLSQIKDKFALPEIPTFVSDVYVPTGAKIRVGTVAAQPGWGSGGGIQYELLERLPASAFRNMRPL